ncbi:MAG: hypothetical protein AB7N71_14910 [Phycisphaerae bacterium]
MMRIIRCRGSTLRAVQNAKRSFVITIQPGDLSDLATDDETVIATNVRFAGRTPAFLTNNTVLFATIGSTGDTRVSRYDLTTGVTTVIVDAVSGFVTGASDDFFITEEDVFTNDDATRRIAIRRYDDEANNKKLAEFRADGLAGQSRIIGDRAIWVNRERKIIIAPLAGGDRTSIKPF